MDLGSRPVPDCRRRRKIEIRRRRFWAGVSCPSGEIAAMAGGSCASLLAMSAYLRVGGVEVDAFGVGAQGEAGGVEDGVGDVFGLHHELAGFLGGRDRPAV